MKVPISWLREYVDIGLSLDALAERLAVAAAEVEQIVPVGLSDEGDNLSRFVVGRVLEAAKHPNADRLQLCQVDVGEPNPSQIVCGAWNFAAGATVAVAQPGATLPDGMQLKRVKLRGETSEGMILAEDEIALGGEHDGIMVLNGEHVPGTPLADVLPLVDHVLEIEVTGNRPDLLSIYGLARDIAALLDTDLRPPPGVEPAVGTAQPVSIEIDDPEGCPRYIGRTFGGVEVGPSPQWLRTRLHRAGMRAISNVVDITNYVMLTFGSPLHAFDLDRLTSERVGVRRAAAGEKLRTLDGADRALDATDLVIVDSDRAIALAAIMGGEETEVGDTTTRVLLEAANFEPVGILKTSERLGLRTEGSNRWEKGVDPHQAANAATYASELLVTLCGATYDSGADVVSDLDPAPSLTFRPARASALIGLEIEESEQQGLLERLGFEVAPNSVGANAAWTVRVPTWRARDVMREIDLVEEVARVHGLEKVPFTLPVRRELFGRLDQAQRLRRRVEDTLVGAGYSEAYTWSLTSDDVDPAALRLPVPLSAEHAVLRTTLVSGLVEAAARNRDVGNRDVALFEIARVYLPGESELPDERWHVGGIVEGGYFVAKHAVELLHLLAGSEPAFERASQPFLHPGKAATVAAGWLGETHPSLLDGAWGLFELDLATLFADVPERTLYEDVVTYPPVHQDLAFVVNSEVLAGSLVDAAREAVGPMLASIRVFDVYEGDQLPDGKKSIALNLSFQSNSGTLSDEDAHALRQRIVEHVAEQLGGELRA
jgi:phenylalanyl-tRNA synthetase beta chain